MTNQDYNYMFINTATDIEVFLYVSGRSFFVCKQGNRDASSVLLSVIDDVLREAGVSLDSLGKIGVCIGPGSFTGLRIGINTIKALSLVHKTPILPVNTLRLNAYNVDSDNIVSVVDGSGGVVYIARYCGDVVDIPPMCIYSKDLASYIQSSDTVVIDSQATASIVGMEFAPLSSKRIERAIKYCTQTVDCMKLEPLYIRKAQPDRGEYDI